MKYIRQDDKFCLLAALCQLNPDRWNYRELRKTYTYVRPAVHKWLIRHHLTRLNERLFCSGDVKPQDTNSLPVTGQGIAIIAIKYGRREGEYWERHAVSYTSGCVLDPGRASPGRLELWEHYLQDALGRWDGAVRLYLERVIGIDELDR